jgi:hypothetical protein
MPHCPAICSTCCGTKVAQIESMNINGRYEKKRLKENSCQFQVASEMKSEEIGITPT